MKVSYVPSDENKSVFGEFDFELGGKVYTKDKVDNNLLKAISNIKVENEKTLDDVVISLIGKKEFDANKPFNPVEVLLLSEWISETLFAPIKNKKDKMDAEEKND